MDFRLIQIFSLMMELISPKIKIKSSQIISLGIVFVLIHFGVLGRIAIADGIRQAVKRESFPTNGDQKNIASTEKNTINIVDKANAPNAKILFSRTIAREVDGSELISIYIKCCRPDISG